MSEDAPLIPTNMPPEALGPSPQEGEAQSLLADIPRLEAAEQESQAKEPAEFSVRINKNMLDGVQIKAPRVEERSRGSFSSPEEEQAIIDAKVTELNNLLEKIKRLPEHLNFQPGITLIVGENGGGKSTLGRALQLVAEYHDAVRFYRQTTPHSKPREAEKFAYGSVIDARGGGTAAENLGMAGLGAYIAPALLDGTTFLSGGRGPSYMDIGGIFGRVQDRSRYRMRDSLTNTLQYDHKSGQMQQVALTIKGEGSFDFKSTRQTVDEELAAYKERRYNRVRLNAHEAKRNNQARVEFVDEPECGLSPRRHQKIVEEIYDIFGTPEGGDIIIAPTNSTVLFESDLPRIDLDYPERGIHRPSDYPDHDAIK